MGKNIFLKNEMSLRDWRVFTVGKVPCMLSVWLDPPYPGGPSSPTNSNVPAESQE